MYKLLTAYVLKMTYEKVSKLKQEGKDNLQAKNESQSYNAVTLSIVYGEVCFFIISLKQIGLLDRNNKMFVGYGIFLKIIWRFLCVKYNGIFILDM